MQGGIFGLNKLQISYLYISQIVPTLIVLLYDDILQSLLFTQIFYAISSYLYIRYISIEKSYYPYRLNQFKKIKFQIHKGLVLGFSAFLLITFYGILFTKIGKVVLPHQVNLGQRFHSQWYYFVIICITGPILEEWFWRLFLPKTFQETYYRSHVNNATYLIFHFVLFSKYVGILRSVPLVGTFFSIGRSMSHIKEKYGILSSIICHYGITLGGLSLYIYLKLTTNMII